MTEQEKTEIRKIIKEEIEAKLSGRPTLTVSKNNNEPVRQDNKPFRIINIETVSPAY